MTTTLARGSVAGDAVVARRGTDTSGRGIYTSGWMWRCWQALLADPRLDPIRSRIIIVQGPWMKLNGGGAVDSAGYHDEGGCLDCRSREFSAAEIALFVLVASDYGFQFWRRDAAHGGMDPHLHGVLGSDYDLSSGAREQVVELLATPRGDGLAGSYGRDYEHRVTPIRQYPPNDLLQEDYMATDDASKKLDLLLKQAEASQKRDVALRKLVKGLSDQVDALTDAVGTGDDDIKRRVTKAKSEVLEALDELGQEA